MVTTRRGGRSTGPYGDFNLGEHVGDDPAAVAANRARLAAATGLSGRMVGMDQVHGDRVAVVRAPAIRSVPGADGLVTDVPGLGLLVLAADCVPILAGDTGARVVGAAHAGRLGAAAGVALRLLETMTGLGARVAAVDVLLGPAICGQCYEVPTALRDEVEAALPGSASRTRWGTPGVDVRAGLARQLAGAGVPTVRIDPRCTFTDAELYSHRRATLAAGAPGAGPPVTGRQGGLVWLDPDRRR
ncbi:peptidoglycan editing factor PgeF [Nakamurella leprariae]|uniref:peptidoglycan editing factor PgeF n=1 Tax=Nakamurella leprariae TaxID=2803911 RepID=UPI002E2ACFCF|nr:peptidoglycan editing factor PgeF [Nakamurella leprariae]